MDNFLASMPTILDKKKKRKGRGIGSGRGVKSGRGTTRHQSAREGIPLGFEGGQGRLTKRFPLLRGKGRNKSRKDNIYVIYTRDLNRFDDGTVVDVQKLQEAGLVDKQALRPKVKLIINGKLTKKVTVKLSISGAAEKAVVSAGGTVEKI